MRVFVWRKSKVYVSKHIYSSLIFQSYMIQPFILQSFMIQSQMIHYTILLYTIQHPTIFLKIVILNSKFVSIERNHPTIAENGKRQTSRKQKVFRQTKKETSERLRLSNARFT